MVFHYNLCEARTTELDDPENERINALAKTIVKLANGEVPTFASFNELQYDIPGVPNKTHTSLGQNLTILYDRVQALTDSKEMFETTTTFKPGNCGVCGRAKKMPDGNYCNSRDATLEELWEYGDSIGCLATLPAQYGVGFWSNHKVVDVRVISKLQWKEFNPEIDLTNYLDQKGDSLPEDITLFDKCCMIVKVNIQGKLIHFVVLHAIPAYNFGSEKSANIARNGDQLGFLEWLLVKNTRIKPPILYDDTGRVLEPIPIDETVIATGDLNEDSTRIDHPGAKHLINIHNDPKYHIFPWQQPTEISKHGDEIIELQLDYMISGGNAIEVVSGSERIGPMDPIKLSDHAAITSIFQIL
jgi:hypothetical protein